jgi:hypothetical protein
MQGAASPYVVISKAEAFSLVELRRNAPIACHCRRRPASLAKHFYRDKTVDRNPGSAAMRVGPPSDSVGAHGFNNAQENRTWIESLSTTKG